MKAVLPIMRKQRRGAIVNVNSIGGIIGVPLIFAYVGSKFALEGFSEFMKDELEGFGIKVILIEPGAKNELSRNARKTKRAMNPDSPYTEFSKKLSEGVREVFKKARFSSPKPSCRSHLKCN